MRFLPTTRCVSAPLTIRKCPASSAISRRQPFGLNEDPSNFSVSCRQNGPIDVDLSKLGDNEEVFSQKTSIFFKTTRIYRVADRPHNTLIYLAISTKIINGSPANAISTVPIMPWPAR
jgi:CreA protein